jgi:N-acetylmuramoyl-L-alanine amidase
MPGRACYHVSLPGRRFPTRVTCRFALFCAVFAVALLVARPVSLAQSATYLVYTSDAKRPLPFRVVNNVDMATLDQVASMFGLTIAQDALVGGFTVRGKGQTILLIPGQSFASIGPGRIVSLPAAVQRDRNTWIVPVEFLSKAVGPAQNVRIDVRKSTHTILVGDVRLPQVSARFERQGPNGRLTFEIQPATPHRITRNGNRLTLRFEAVALEWTPPTGVVAEFVSGVRVDATSVQIDLGPTTAGYRADDTDPTHLQIDLLAPAPVAPPPPPPPAPAAVPGTAPTTASPIPGRGQSLELPPPPRPAIDTSSGLRTVVIDPGHGGEDTGAKGERGTVEKDYVLQFARKLKTAIEGRIGLRVLLTRDTDENVPPDKRAAFANNNKADLFISLHANAAVRPSVNGMQVLSLKLDDYAAQMEPGTAADVPVAVLGGGSRAIDVLPWDTAQVGYTEESSGIATILRRHLAEAKIPLFNPAASRMPLRPLVGVSMPAVLVELGFLTNTADEQALIASDRPQQVIDAILATISDVRRGVPADAAPRPER